MGNPLIFMSCILGLLSCLEWGIYLLKLYFWKVDSSRFYFIAPFLRWISREKVRQLMDLGVFGHPSSFQLLQHSVTWKSWMYRTKMSITENWMEMNKKDGKNWIVHKMFALHTVEMIAFYCFHQYHCCNVWFFSGVVFVDNLDSFSLNVANALAKLGAVPWILERQSLLPKLKIAFLKD